MFERSVELITGPYRSGKTMWLLEELVRHSREQPLATRPVLLTVPSHRYKGLLEKQLAQILRKNGAPGLCAVKILPFYDLCHLIMRQASVNFHLLADGLRPAVLLKAIQQVESIGKLNTFASIANFAGTHAQMLELIDELMRAALSPREVATTLSRAASSESRYQELAAIYQAYWDELEKLNVYDERKLAFKVREILPLWAKAAPPPALLAIDGFDRLSPLQLSVLSSLARHCQRTLITFDYVSQGPKLDEYTWKQKSINGLRLAFAEGGLALKETQFEQSVPEVETELISTLDRQLEMEEVARQVKSCLVRGVPPSEIVVVTRSLQSYLPAVKLAFERASIPYFPDEAIPIATLPLIKYVRRLLSLPLSKFKRVEVIRSLRSAFCNHEWLGIDKEVVDKLDRQSLQSVVVEESDWLEFIKQTDLPAEARALRRFFTLLQGEVVQKTASLSTHVAHVEDVIDALLRLPSDDEYANPFIAWEEHQGLVELRKVLADLIREEELLGQSYGSELYSYKQFFVRLEQAFENSNFRRRAGGDKFVTVCGADLVPNRRFRVVLIAGLVEGDFPRRLERPGLLSRDEVRKWGSLGIDIENPRQHDSFEFSLYRSLLERAVDKVLLSYPHFESSNEELVPSFFLVGSSEQSKALPDCLPPRLAALQRPVSVEELAMARLWYKGAGSVSDYLQKTLESNLPQDYAEESERLLRRLQDPLAIVEARTSSESRQNRKLACGDFSDLVALGLLKIDMPSAWSPSALSTYGRCPFQYWVSYVLKQEEIEEPTAGLDIRLKGEVYHKALELFYSGLRERGLRLNSADQTFLLSFFEECIAAALTWVQVERKVKLDEFWEFERKDIAFRLRRFLKEEINSAIKDNTGFEPVFFERPFGGELVDVAAGTRSSEVVLQRPETLEPGAFKELRLRGRIDRIDADGQGRLRVVDYKSGSSPIKSDDILAGRELQMPIYSFAAASDLELMSCGKVTAGLYLSISKGAAIGKVDFEDKEVDLLQVSRETIFDFVEKIAKGQFPVAPSKREVCQKCNHSAVCRIAELGAEED